MRQKVKESSNLITIDDLGEAFGNMARCIIKIVEHKLTEQTKNGKHCYNEAIEKAKFINDLLFDLDYKIKHNILIDQDNARGWMITIQRQNNDIVSIQDQAREATYFDEDDKMLLFKASHIYATLLSEFNSKIQDYNLLHPTKKIVNTPPLNLRKSTKYDPDPEEIKIETEKFKSLKEKLIPTYDLPEKTLEWLKNTYPTEERSKKINGKTGLNVEEDASYLDSLSSVMGDNNSKLIVDDNDIPIAFLSWEPGQAEVGNLKSWLKHYLRHEFKNLNLDSLEKYNEDEEIRIISEFHLFNFSDRPNLLIVKDVCKFLDENLKKYPLIFWTVHNDNEAKEIYDKMISKFNGFSFLDGRMTGYVLVQGQSSIPSAYLKESKEFLGKSPEPTIIDKIGEAFGNMAGYIEKIVNDRILEQTKNGKYNYNRAMLEAKLIKGLLKDLENKINKGILVDQINVRSWNMTINRGNYNILSIQDQAKSDPHFDKEDIILIFKASHIYANLLSEFNARIQDYNLLHPTRKIDKAPELEMKKSTKYDPDPEEIKIETEKFKSLKEKLIPTYDLPEKTLKWLEDTYPTEERKEKIGNFVGLYYDSIDTNESYLNNLSKDLGNDYSKFIVDNNDIPIAFFSWEVNTLSNADIRDTFEEVFKRNPTILNLLKSQKDIPIISEFHLFNFTNKPNLIIVKDVCKFLDENLKKYQFIMWSVNDDNDNAKEMYDKMVKKFDGIIYSEDYLTIYILIQGKSSVPPAYLRETLFKDAFHGSTHDFDSDKGLNYPEKRHNSLNGSDTLGAYFTPEEEVAVSYGPFVTEADVEIVNPKIIDLQGRDYDEYEDGKKDEDLGKELGESPYSIDGQTFIAKEQGYDGLVAKNVRNDLSSWNAAEEFVGHEIDNITSDVIVPFSIDQIKDAKFNYIFDENVDDTDEDITRRRKIAKAYNALGMLKYRDQFDLIREGILRSSEFKHLTELKKKQILRMLATAGITMGLSLGALNYNPKDIKDTKPQEITAVQETPQEEKADEGYFYRYSSPELGNILEKYRGDFPPELVETFLQAESRMGKNMKYDNNGGGVAQISKILIKDYNQRHGTNYEQEQVWYDDDLNIKIGMWFLHWCYDQYLKNTGQVPDDTDLYLMYNTGVKNYLTNRDKFRNENFKPYINYLNSKEDVFSKNATAML